MGKKATADHTPELPSLDDPRWGPMRVDIEQRRQRTGDIGLAIGDIERDAASDRVRIMRRNLTTGESEFVPAAFWSDHFIGFLTPSSVIVCRQTDPDRHKTDEYGNLVAERLDGWAWFVWPTSAASAPAEHDAIEEPLLPVDRAVAVLRDLYPTKAKMPRSLKAATKAVDKECKNRGWQVVGSPDTVHRAAVKLRYRAPRKGE